MDREHKAHGQAVKDIYVYRLVRDARQRLMRPYPANKYRKRPGVTEEGRPAMLNP